MPLEEVKTQEIDSRYHWCQRLCEVGYGEWNGRKFNGCLSSAIAICFNGLMISDRDTHIEFEATLHPALGKNVTAVAKFTEEEVNGCKTDDDLRQLVTQRMGEKLIEALNAERKDRVV